MFVRAPLVYEKNGKTKKLDIPKVRTRPVHIANINQMLQGCTDNTKPKYVGFDIKTGTREYKMHIHGDNS